MMFLQDSQHETHVPDYDDEPYPLLPSSNSNMGEVCGHISVKNLTVCFLYDI